MINSRRLDGLTVLGVALLARVAVLLWARGRFPAVADGTYYDIFARRLAAGQGYTWAWPDGTITYAAHYPVGYPALLALPYGLLGGGASVAMGINALLGAGLAWAIHALLAPVSSRRGALLGGLAVALHPALLPYTAAVMTEGVTASLLALSAALLARRTGAGRIVAGLVLGAAVLVRPQSLVLAPLFGLLAARASARRWREVVVRLATGVLITALALGVCAPWTLRNCRRMGSCALVSVNGGWNLLIGTQTTTGAWEPVDVPGPCRTVWDEAAKDACFGDAARSSIARNPAAWLGRVPSKLAVTLDYFGGAPWYLHQSNAQVFPYGHKVALGFVETVASRLLLIGALVALARRRGARRGLRLALGVLGGVFALQLHGWPAYVLLVIMGLLLGPRALLRGPVLIPVTLAVVAATALMHGAFFGAGRYGLVAAPFVAALAFLHPGRGLGSGEARAPVRLC